MSTPCLLQLHVNSRKILIKLQYIRPHIWRMSYLRTRTRLWINCEFCFVKVLVKSMKLQPYVLYHSFGLKSLSNAFWYFQGLLVNWDIQKNIWDYVFGKDCCSSNFSETPVIITEPYFNFACIQEAVAEIFFEDYECQAFLRINGKFFANKTFSNLSIWHNLYSLIRQEIIVLFSWFK